MNKLIIHFANFALNFAIPKDIITGPFNNAGQHSYFKILIGCVLRNDRLWRRGWLSSIRF